MIKKILIGLGSIFILYIFLSIIFPIYIGIPLAAYESKKVYNENTCGVEMNEIDILNYNTKSKYNEDAYNGKAYELYEIINDSIREKLPDTLSFEIFLSYSNKDEIAISIHCPKNEEFMNKITCSYFNSKFNSEIPIKKYLVLYSYTNPDGSGDSNLEYSLKNK